MPSINNALNLVIFSLVELSIGISDNTTNTTQAITVENAFPQLKNLSQKHTSTRALTLGGQNLTQCCMLAMNQALIINNESLMEPQNPAYILGSSEDHTNGPMPCGASYSSVLLALNSVNRRRKWRLII